MFKKNLGFTLIELITVLAIVGILIGFASPSIKVLFDKSNEIDLDATTYAMYKILCDTAIDNQNENIKNIFDLDNNPHLFNSLNIDEYNVMFLFKNDTNNLTYEKITSDIHSDYLDKFIIVIPISNNIDNQFDFTKDVYIFQPEGSKTLLNGNFTY